MSEVKVYTKTVCPKCMAAKFFLDSNEIKYETINLDQSEETKDKLLGLGFMVAPVIEYNNKYYKDMSEFQKLVDELK